MGCSCPELGFWNSLALQSFLYVLSEDMKCALSFTLRATAAGVILKQCISVSWEFCNFLVLFLNEVVDLNHPSRYSAHRGLPGLELGGELSTRPFPVPPLPPRRVTGLFASLDRKIPSVGI